MDERSGSRHAPHGHWRTTTFVAGLRSGGIIAPLVLDGPMTGETFRAYVEQFLAPALSPGDGVVMDNLAAHKVAGVAEAIATAGASILYLPPYSPDLNPIEQMLSPSSKHCCENLPLVPARRSGTRSANCSMPLLRANVGTTSRTPAIPSTKA